MGRGATVKEPHGGSPIPCLGLFQWGSPMTASNPFVHLRKGQTEHMQGLPGLCFKSHPQGSVLSTYSCDSPATHILLPLSSPPHTLPGLEDCPPLRTKTSVAFSACSCGAWVGLACPLVATAAQEKKDTEGSGLPSAGGDRGCAHRLRRAMPLLLTTTMERAQQTTVTLFLLLFCSG